MRAFFRRFWALRRLERGGPTPLSGPVHAALGPRAGGALTSR